MPDLPLDITLPLDQIPLDDVLEQGVRAEAQGYGHVWAGEAWGTSVVPVLTAIAERTDHLGIGTHIVPVYTRTPSLIGQIGATFQRMYGDRFRLGIGTSGPAVIENWHGVEYEQPLKHLREHVEIAKAVQSGESVEYDGELFELSGFRIWSDAPEPPAPIEVAALGPKAVELTGRFADGWRPFLLSPDGFAERFADLERGADLGDRDVSALRSSLQVTTSVMEDSERALQQASKHVAFYVGAMGTYYRDTIARQGYEQVATDIHDAWSAGNREHATEIVRETLADDFVVAGTPDEAKATIERFAALDGIDAITLAFPREASSDEVEATLAALAPSP